MVGDFCQLCIPLKTLSGLGLVDPKRDWIAWPISHQDTHYHPLINKDYYYYYQKKGHKGQRFFSNIVQQMAFSQRAITLPFSTAIKPGQIRLRSEKKERFGWNNHCLFHFGDWGAFCFHPTVDSSDPFCVIALHGAIKMGGGKCHKKISPLC